MSIKAAFIIDSFHQIKAYKDSSVAMMLEGQRRGWEIYALQPSDMSFNQGEIFAEIQRLCVFDREQSAKKPWYEIKSTQHRSLHGFDVVFMRKDPPMNMDYMYTTHLLDLLKSDGVLVINDPQALRDVNEKLYTAWFPQCCVETVVTAKADHFLQFLGKYRDIIVKPLGAMGGASIFRLTQDDPNINVVLETMTNHGGQLAMAQRYIPDIKHGDKRLILINGEPVPYALARIPKPGETRGNLAAGASAEGRELTERDRWLCGQIADTMRAKGLIFVGIDVIGDYITEINVTSPTGIRELDKMYSINIAAGLMDWVEQNVT